MRYQDSTRGQVVHSTRGSVLAVGLALALASSAAADPITAVCKPYGFPGDAVWEIVPDLTLSGDEGRIAVIVESKLYESVFYSIENFAFGLWEDGYSVVVARFSGPATNPEPPGEPKGLRERLQDLYAEPGSLVGAVLVGDLPYVCYECLSGDDYTSWPTDAFFMDMDGIWEDNEQHPHHTLFPAGKYDNWIDTDHHAEIWVSRIMGHNLPMIGASEAQIINAYLSRNRTLREDALRPSNSALVFDSGETGGTGCSSAPVALGRAFDTVDSECYGDATASDYLYRLGLLPPDNYHFVYEESHGLFWYHTFHDGDPEEDVWNTDYLALEPHVLGFTLMSCYTCNFAFEVEGDYALGRDFLGGIVAFNPSAKTLVVNGYARTALVAAPYNLWNDVGAGRSFGEGYRAMFDGHDGQKLAMVLLGDGSLKPPAVTWTGDGEHWNDFDNWDSDDVPGEYDHVRIRAGDVDMVTVDVGTYQEANDIWSLTIKEPGTTSLNLPGNRWLRAASSLTVEPDANCTVTLGSNAFFGSKLELEKADLVNATVILDDSSAGSPTTLNVAGTIRDCAQIEIGQHGTITAGAIDNCEQVDVAADAHVSADWITNCAVDVEPDGNVLAMDYIGNSGFQVGENAVVSTGYIIGSAAAPVAQDWTISNGTVVADGWTSTLWGNWTLSGGSATFKQMTATEAGAIFIDLGDGASMTVESSPPPPRPEAPGAPFPDTFEYQLIYGDGANEFAIGIADDAVADRVYFGDHTVIMSQPEASQPTLNLNLACELHIASDFREPHVYEAWDSTGADITARSIWLQGDSAQAIEVISPDLSAWYRGEPVVFLDVPCQGAFRDLIIPEWSGPGGSPNPAKILNQYDNGADSEVGCFRDVAIHVGRTLDFVEGQGVIYYWDQSLITDGTIRYWHDPPLITDPVIVDDESQPPLEELIIHAVGTIYGDWNGDCIITNAELAALQTVIAHGPYDPLMDCDCDNEINNTELAKFMLNMAQQPECGRGMLRGDGGGGGFGEDWPLMEGEPMHDWPLFDEWVPYEDVPELAAWVAEQLSPEELAVTIEALTAAAVDFADTPVGYDIGELLLWLE